MKSRYEVELYIGYSGEFENEHQARSAALDFVTDAVPEGVEIRLKATGVYPDSPELRSQREVRQKRALQRFVDFVRHDERSLKEGISVMERELIQLEQTLQRMRSERRDQKSPLEK